jgi:hypothetical protein
VPRRDTKPGGHVLAPGSAATPRRPRSRGRYAEVLGEPRPHNPSVSNSSVHVPASGGSAQIWAKGPDSLNSPYQGRDEAHRGEVITSEPVVAGCDASEVLQSVEGGLNAPAKLIETLAEAERLLPIAFVGDDGLGSALVQLLSQFGAVVGFIAKHVFRRLGPADQALGYRAVVRFTAGQQDGD